MRQRLLHLFFRFDACHDLIFSEPQAGFMRKLYIGFFGKVQKHFSASGIDQLFHILQPSDVPARIQRNIDSTGNLFDHGY